MTVNDEQTNGFKYLNCYASRHSVSVIRHLFSGDCLEGENVDYRNRSVPHSVPHTGENCQGDGD